ncbi:MAG TPA: hypothetical protein V6C90_15825 [Coleofasciculaceae cyanobacterium]
MPVATLHIDTGLEASDRWVFLWTNFKQTILQVSVHQRFLSTD